MEEEILDDDLLNKNKFQLLEKEEILWKGEPKNYFSFTLFEVFGPYDSISLVTGFQVYILGATFLGTRDLISEGALSTAIIALGQAIIIVLLPDVLKHYRKVNTKYYFTNKRVVVETWKLGRREVVELFLDDLRQMTYQEFKNGIGVIFFIPKRKIRFRMRDFFASRKREYLTFELIPNVVDVWDSFNLFLKQ